MLGVSLVLAKHDIKDSGVDSNPATGAAVETLRCQSIPTSLYHDSGEVARHKPYSIVGLLSFVKCLFRISASHWGNGILVSPGANNWLPPRWRR